MGASNHTADIEDTTSMIREHIDAFLVEALDWRTFDNSLNEGQSFGQSRDKPRIVGDVIANHVFVRPILLIGDETIATGNQLTDSAYIYHGLEHVYW